MRRNNILCVNERTMGESPDYHGYIHYFTFPDMTWIKREVSYYDAGWAYPGNDCGQSAFLCGDMYMANCYGRNLLKLHNGLTPTFIEEIMGANTSYPTGYDATSFRPVGVAHKNGNWFMLSAGDHSLIKFSYDWEIISSTSYDNATYGEHNGLAVAPNGNFIAGTQNGYLVEFNENCDYIAEHVINTSYQYRGSAIWNGYIVTARIWETAPDTGDTYITVLSYPDFKIISNIDLSSYLNTVGNITYGTFFLN